MGEFMCCETSFETEEELNKHKAEMHSEAA